MRIAMVFNRYRIRAGEEVIYEDEASLLESHGCQVIRIDIRTKIPRGLLGKVSFAINSVWSRNWYKKMSGMLETLKPDVVHVQNHFPLFSPSIYYACRDQDIPVVMTLHNYRLFCPASTFFRHGKVCELCANKTLPWPGLIYRCYHDSALHSATVGAIIAFHNWRKTYSNAVDLIMVNTEFGRLKFKELGIPEDKLVVKPNGLFPDPGPGDTGSDFALFVGRLDHAKGLDTLFRAWLLLDNPPPLKIAGSGPDEERVKAMSQKHNSIEFLGVQSRESVYRLMKDAAFLVFTSQWYEGMPMTILESFAMNTPVIASNLGAMSSMIIHKKNGLHFTAGDPYDLADQVRWIMDNPNDLTTMSYNARADFESKYTADINYQLLMKFYQRAIENRRP